MQIDIKIFVEFIIFFVDCQTFVSQLGHYVMGSLENVSILHVMLLIYLRLYIIKNPMSRNGPIKFRRLILVVTWLIPIILKLPVTFLWQYRYSFNIYMNIQFHLFSTLSVVLIVFLYGKMLYTIRSQKLKNRKILNATRVAKEKENNINDYRNCNGRNGMLSSLYNS